MVDFDALLKKMQEHKAGAHSAAPDSRCSLCPKHKCARCGNSIFIVGRCGDCGDVDKEEAEAFHKGTTYNDVQRSEVPELSGPRTQTASAGTLTEEMLGGAAEPVVEEEEEEDEDSPLPQWAFVTGVAGTGKTFLVKSWEDHHPEAELVATTGIAAINLGGTTVNARFGYFDTDSLKDSYTAGYIQARLRKLAESGTRHYILDEVSMLDAEQLTVFVEAFDEVNSSRPTHRQLGITVVGDFAQLPPVKAKFAFESPHWGRFAANTTKLTQIRRQDEVDFVEALQAVRKGQGSKALEYFASRLEKQLDRDYEGPTLLARNEQVDRYNGLKLATIPGEEITFQSSRFGKQRSEWKNIPEILTLKEGALVMILANRSSKFGYVYVNGDLGILQKKWKDAAGEVEMATVVLARGGSTVDVLPVTREVKEPTGLKTNPYEITGGITYMPLRVAYATTTHKSQGLSLDKVQVDFRDHFFESPGMLYVALSRARSSGGLRLVGTEKLFEARVKCDPRLKGWL